VFSVKCGAALAGQRQVQATVPVLVGMNQEGECEVWVKKWWQVRIHSVTNIDHRSKTQRETRHNMERNLVVVVMAPESKKQQLGHLFLLPASCVDTGRK
jgi:hypothetical protein